MKNNFLICTDLDRTLIPNGEPPESANARGAFHRLAQHPQVSIAYVTGRHRQLVAEAISEYELPTPDYVLGDVGSTIYEIVNKQWQCLTPWQETIAKDWQGYTHNDLMLLFQDIATLQLQEPEKQNSFKLSYYAPANCDVDELINLMQDRLQQKNIKASLIWSIDDLTNTGLLDILPMQASKLHAIEFLIRHKGFTEQGTVFAGDSGNDLAVLCSHIQSVLVANAREDVRQQALTLAQKNNCTKALYLAHGGCLGMNGNYAAGIIEGVLHYIPELSGLFQDFR